MILQVGEVSDETVIYGFGSCVTLSSEWVHCKLQPRRLIRVCALHEEERKQLSNIRKYGHQRECSTPRWTAWLIVGHKINLNLSGGGLEYLHCSPASCKRQQKGKCNPMPRGATGLPCSWGKLIQEPGPPDWGSLNIETIKYAHEPHGTQTLLARPSNNWKLLTWPLVREGAPHQQTCNCLKKVIKERRRKIGRGS
jgi:hypothetical protein